MTAIRVISLLESLSLKGVQLSLPHKIYPWPPHERGTSATGAVEAHVQVPAATRVQTTFVLATSCGALIIPQVIVAVPLAATPATARLQFDVAAAAPPANASVGSTPPLSASSTPGFNADVSAIAADTLALAWYRLYCGIAIAAKIPIIATTIINSIRVKPFWFFILVLLMREAWWPVSLPATTMPTAHITAFLPSNPLGHHLAPTLSSSFSDVFCHFILCIWHLRVD